jgi:tetratricopeptide (TPR) repeat protein
MSDSDVPDEALAAYQAGRVALDAGDLNVAVTQLEASVSAFPHYKALELLGEAWLKKGEPQRAVVPLAAATTLNRQVRAPSLLAETLLVLGDRLQAHRVAQLALERDPHNRKARAVLAATAEEYEAWSKEYFVSSKRCRTMSCSGRATATLPARR